MGLRFHFVTFEALEICFLMFSLEPFLWIYFI